MNYYTEYYGYDIGFVEDETFNDYVEIATSTEVNEDWFDEFNFEGVQ